jgi:hypothetical protein
MVTLRSMGSLQGLRGPRTGTEGMVLAKVSVVRD